ncbi:MAG: four helix bundle protein [Nevskiaceae bacterium]|nr:MAG: four helix bundle protein [Nevskiaceae bacterium]TBR75123.1 MAG: four helix bundle protein [Nevskiaceae bacterium]
MTVWHDAMRFVRQVYDHTAGLPAEERFGLQSEMRRAAVGTPSNIAAGAVHRFTADFIRRL